MAKNDMPEIAAVSITSPYTVVVTWKAGGRSKIDLTGWIATGGDLLKSLKDPDVFKNVRIANYGDAIAWDNDEMAIDALHLEKLAEEQRPFGAKEAAQWQKHLALSNNEAADFLGVSVSTWNLYKAAGNIPMPVAMTCRASLRDPIILQAHLKPRKAGRPRRAEAVG